MPKHSEKKAKRTHFQAIVDKEQILNSLHDIFQEHVDLEVVQMILEENSWNEEKAFESLASMCTENSRTQQPQSKFALIAQETLFSSEVSEREDSLQGQESVHELNYTGDSDTNITKMMQGENTLASEQTENLTSCDFDNIDSRPGLSAVTTDMPEMNVTMSVKEDSDSTPQDAMESLLPPGEHDGSLSGQEIFISPDKEMLVNPIIVHGKHTKRQEPVTTTVSGDSQSFWDLSNAIPEEKCVSSKWEGDSGNQLGSDYGWGKSKFHFPELCSDSFFLEESFKDKSDDIPVPETIFITTQEDSTNQKLFDTHSNSDSDNSLNSSLTNALNSSLEFTESLSFIPLHADSKSGASQLESETKDREKNTHIVKTKSNFKQILTMLDSDSEEKWEQFQSFVMPKKSLSHSGVLNNSPNSSQGQDTKKPPFISKPSYSNICNNPSFVTPKNKLKFGKTSPQSVKSLPFTLQNFPPLQAKKNTISANHKESSPGRAWDKDRPPPPQALATGPIIYPQKSVTPQPKKTTSQTVKQNSLPRLSPPDELAESKPCLVLMRGLPGSGKSTLAKRLLKQHSSGVILSADDYFFENGVYVFDQSQLSNAHDWNKQRAIKAIFSREKLVIIDNTNTQKWEMEPYAKLADQHGYAIKIMEPDTWWKFKCRELSRRNSHGVSYEKIKKMSDRYDHNVTVEMLLQAIRSDMKSPTTSLFTMSNEEKVDGTDQNISYVPDNDPIASIYSNKKGEEQTKEALLQSSPDYKDNDPKSVDIDFSDNDYHGKEQVKKDILLMSQGDITFSDDVDDDIKSVDTDFDYNSEEQVKQAVSEISQDDKVSLETEDFQTVMSDIGSVNDNQTVMSDIDSVNDNPKENMLQIKGNNSEEQILNDGEVKVEAGCSSLEEVQGIQLVCTNVCTNGETPLVLEEISVNETSEFLGKQNRQDSSSEETKSVSVNQSDRGEDKIKNISSDQPGSTLSHDEIPSALESDMKGDKHCDKGIKLASFRRIIDMDGSPSSTSTDYHSCDEGNALVEGQTSDCGDLFDECPENLGQVKEVSTQGHLTVEPIYHGRSKLFRHLKDSVNDEKLEDGNTMKGNSEREDFGEARKLSFEEDVDDVRKIPSETLFGNGHFARVSNETKSDSRQTVYGELFDMGCVGQDEMVQPLSSNLKPQVGYNKDENASLATESLLTPTQQIDSAVSIGDIVPEDVKQQVDELLKDSVSDADIENDFDRIQEELVAALMFLDIPHEHAEAAEHYLVGQLTQRKSQMQETASSNHSDSLSFHDPQPQRQRKKTRSGSNQSVSFHEDGIDLIKPDLMASGAASNATDAAAADADLTSWHSPKPQRWREPNFPSEPSFYPIPNPILNADVQILPSKVSASGESISSSMESSPTKKSRRKKKNSSRMRGPLLEESVKNKLLSPDWTLPMPEKVTVEPLVLPKSGKPVKPIMSQSSEITSQDLKVLDLLNRDEFDELSEKYGDYACMICTGRNINENQLQPTFPVSYSENQRDQSTLTEAVFDRDEAIMFMKDSFPHLHEDELIQVLEQCSNDVDWAINLLLDWKCHVRLTEEDKQKFIDNMHKHSKMSLTIPKKAAAQSLPIISPSSLMDLCIHSIEDLKIADHQEIESQVIRSGMQRLQSMEDSIRSTNKSSPKNKHECVCDEDDDEFSEANVRQLASKVLIEESSDTISDTSEGAVRRKSEPELGVNRVMEWQMGGWAASRGRSVESTVSKVSSDISEVASQGQDDALSTTSTEDILGLQLPLQLPGEFVQALLDLFGPVGNSSTCSADMLVHVDFETAKMLHSALHRGLPMKSEAEISQQVQEDEILARKLQDEENASNSLSNGRRGKNQGHPKPLSMFTNHPPKTGQSKSVTPLKDIIKEEMEKQKKEELEHRLLEASGKAGAMATRLTRQKLYERFPNVEESVLDDIFMNNGLNYEDTVFAITDFLQQDSPPKHVMTPEAAQQYEEKLIEAAKQQSLSEMLDSYLFVQHPSKDYQQVEGQDYEDFRGEANVHHRLRLECFQKAQEAHGRGMREVAAFYSRQGHEHTKKIKEANHRAAEIMLCQRNNLLQDQNTLDLHGLHVDEAIRALSTILPEKVSEYAATKDKRKQHLLIITGRGSHSRGGVARVKPAVLTYLKQQEYRITEVNSGVVRINLKR